MNIRNVLRTYSLLRQLTDDESALLETLRGLSEGERDLLVQSLAPAKAAVKKAAKKAANKSQRASGMAAAIGGSLQQSRAAERAVDPNYHCQQRLRDGTLCDEAADANVHHLRGVTGYHEFVAAQSSADNGSEPVVSGFADDADMATDVAHEAGAGG
jgi:hypothetical protein